MNKIVEINTITRYLIRFLLGETVEDDIAGMVGYTADKEEFEQYKVVIKPSGFFDEKTYGTEVSMPTLPLRGIEGTPLLFGQSETTRSGNTIVLYADIIASAYFLLSRYEEHLRRDVRDEHGRFKGKESLPYRADFIHRPVVDEYGRLLRKYLRDSGINIKEPPLKIDRVFLTHDVDAPFACRTWRNIARGLKERQNLCKLLKIKFGDLTKDPYYTFPYIFEQDAQLRNRRGAEDCRTLLFFKAGGHSRQDRPYYDFRSKDMQQLLDLMKDYGCMAGLHSSYSAGMKPSLIAAEKARLEEAIGVTISANRHHFLASREPEDMETLAKIGITDDFTMGYADVAGFRLGTTRAVKYINPLTRRLSDTLTLHPLAVMDSTLSETKYMNLTEAQAREYCLKLIQATSNNHGSLTLLWHNTSFAEDGYLRNLYTRLIQTIE